MNAVKFLGYIGVTIMNTIKKTGMVGLGCIAALLMLVSTAADADATATVTVTSMEITNANVYVQISGSWPTTGGCTNYTWGVIPSTSGNLGLLTSTLYDVYANGDPVVLFVNGCITVSGVSYPIITYLKVTKS